MRSISDLYNSIELCQNKDICRASFKKDPGKFYIMQKPWVGSRYAETKMLFVGINMNEPGDTNTDLNNFINNPDVQRKFMKGGLFGFMPELVRRIKRLDKSLTPRQIYDYFAFTNMIKCSPSEIKLSKPTDKMWETCSFMREEIMILKPAIVIAMGCYDLLVRKFQDGIKALNIEENLRPYLTRVEIEEHTFSIIKIDHPAQPIVIRSIEKRLPMMLELLGFDDSEMAEKVNTIKRKLEEIPLLYFIPERLIKLAIHCK